jgi:putative addiction module killer protein
MQARVLARVARMKKGQFGDCKAIDRSLYELRLFFGPGYRVYFGEHDGKTVLILAGGDRPILEMLVTLPSGGAASLAASAA